MQDRVAHWLRPNAAARMPRRVVCFDSEARIEFDGTLQTQTFALACASFDRLDHDCQPEAESETLSTYSPEELWAWIVARTNSSHRTVCFAHNLSYDIRLTGALDHLPSYGYELRQWALGDYGCWFYLSDGKCSLYLLDSLSFLPASLDKIASLVKLRRARLPKLDDPPEKLLARCANDVVVLRRAILDTLRLFHEHDCGDFRTTGAGQGSAAFRHKFLVPRTLLVHADMDALAAERVACYAGRAEVWRHGPIEGPLYEYDLPNAYARIGLDCELPVELLGEFYPASLDNWYRCRENYALLAECEISTEIPTVPTVHKNRIIWPVGCFVSTLWDNELDLALQYGATAKVRRLWAYQRAPLLKEWAGWILDGLNGRHLGAHPLGRLILKDWSRSLIGRFGLRYPTIERLGPMPDTDVCLYPVADLIEQRDTHYLHVGRTVWEQSARIESPNSTPCVMGYVMAECRRRLWECMRMARRESVLSIDTDGIIVDQDAAYRLDALSGLELTFGLRRKAEYKRGDFRAPRNIDLDEERRVSGVPKQSERLSPGIFRGEVWESLPAALRRRRSSSVVIFERTFNVSETDPRRVHFDDGSTGPIRVMPSGSSRPKQRLAVAPPSRYVS